jgi:Cytochrome P450
MIGISASPYNAAFRRKRQLYLSILKNISVSQRSIEDRINVEVAELIDQIQLAGGQPFDPNEMIHKCVLNVMIGLVFGRRYPFGHAILAEFRAGIHKWFNGIVQEVELFPFLRFVPSFRDRVQTFLKMETNLLELIEREVCRLKQQIRIIMKTKQRNGVGLFLNSQIEPLRALCELISLMHSEPSL